MHKSFACTMYVFVCAWCLPRREESIRSPGTGVAYVWGTMWVLWTKARYSAKAINAFNYWATSLASKTFSDHFIELELRQRSRRPHYEQICLIMPQCFYLNLKPMSVPRVKLVPLPTVLNHPCLFTAVSLIVSLGQVVKASLLEFPELGNFSLKQNFLAGWPSSRSLGKTHMLAPPCKVLVWGLDLVLGIKMHCNVFC